MKFGQTNPSGLADGFEIYFVLDYRCYVAHAHANQDGQAADNSFEEDGNQHDGSDGNDCGDRALFKPVPGGWCQVEAN